jgi:PAS domain-containing protein
VDTAPDVGAAGDDRMEWAARVQRLEAELAGLRRAMRGRAVIEQAKGLLAGTLGVSPDAAFKHLSRLSQHENLRLVEVSARIVGVALPVDQQVEVAEAAPSDARPVDPITYLPNAPASAGAPPAVPPMSVAVPDADLDLPAAMRVRLQTATAAVHSAHTVGELVERLLGEGAGWLEPSAVMLYVPEPDGALRLAASAGLPAQVASDWQRIPSQVNTAVRKAITTGQPIWLDGTAEHGFTLIGTGAARACLPLRPDAGIEIIWAAPRELTSEERRYLSTLAGAAERRLDELAGVGAELLPDPTYWLRAALEAVPAPLLLLAPVRDEAGEVVDFVIDYASEQAGQPYGQDSAALVGTRLLDVRPDLAVSGVFDAYRRVLATGTPWRRGVQAETILVDGVPRPAVISRSAVRIGGGLLACWQPHDAEVALDRAEAVEELGRLGYAEWDLVSGEGSWTAGAYRVLDRPPGERPLALGQLPVLDEDLPDLQRDLRRLLVDGEPLDTQFRIHAGGGTRALRMVGAPRAVETGSPTVLRAMVQDVTDLVLKTDVRRAGARAAAMRRVHRGGATRREG